jgi:hypothetical protein
MSESQNPLVGKTIERIEMTSDKLALKFFITGGEPIVAKADADCCSNTWIEHISLPYKGFPCVVISAEDVEMPDQGAQPDRDVICYYGFKIQTDKGDMVIDYRNESNGYYGGSLCWDDHEFYGGVYNQNCDNGEWRELAKDF